MLRTQSALMLAFAVLACNSMHMWGSPPPRTDVYDDPLPDGVRVRMGTMQLRHTDAQAVFSADGRTLISCGQHNGLVRHWDIASGRLLRETHLCKTPREKKGLVEVTLGGRCAAMRMKDGVLLRDVESGEERGRLPLEDDYEIHEATSSADGRFLLVKKNAGKERTAVELWDVVRGKKIQRGKYKDIVWKTSLSCDGKRVALITREEIHLWDTVTGKELRKTGIHCLGMCFSPDSKTLAVDSSEGSILLLDAATLREQEQLKSPDGHKGPFAHFEYSADGLLLAAVGNEEIVVWDVTTRTVKHRLPESRVDAFTFAPDGKTLACWGGVLGREISLRDIATGKWLHPRAGHSNNVFALAVSPDGKAVASGALQDPYLLLWDAARGRLLRPLKGNDTWIGTCAFSSDGTRLVSGGAQGSIQVWDVPRSAEVRRLVVDETPDETFLQLSPDGKCLNAISLGLFISPRLTVWDLTTGKQLSQRPYKVDIHREEQRDGGVMWIEEHVAFAPDGQSVTVRNGQHLAIEDVKSGRVLALLPEKIGRPVRFSPDGYLVAAAALRLKKDPSQEPTMEGIRLIERATRQEVISIKTGEGHLVDFSRDGRLLASIDKEAIHIWHVATGEEWFRRAWPERLRSTLDYYPATSLAFLPDGRGVVTGMEDGTIVIWDVPEPRPPSRPQRPETLETLWSALAGEPRKAHRAIYTLAATPAATVPFLADHLKPAAAIDAKLVSKLLADLDSEQFAVREAAQRELTQRRDDIEPALRRFLESKPTLETRRRIDAILAAPRPVPPAATLRTLRAIRVLEQIGTAEARELLRKLAGGAAEVRETREAKAALDRLARQAP